jgi:hypothetical protein
VKPDDWTQIPNDDSAYSQYWSDPTAFQPQQFADNTKKEQKWNDVGWAIAFLINLVLTIVLLAISWSEVDDYGTSAEVTLGKDGAKVIGSTIGVGIGLALAFNALHFAFFAFAPMAYINCSFFIAFGVALIACIAFAIAFSPYVMVFPAIVLLIGLCCYCCLKKYIELSACVLGQSAAIICKYPSVILILFMESILQLGIALMFIFALIGVQLGNMSDYIYIYFVFSYAWVSWTVSYVAYTAVAGTAATWYFLAGTEWMPDHPAGEALKRSFTKSFGSCSFAAFILAMIALMEHILDMDVSGGGALACVFLLLKCIAMCVLAILKCLVKWVNRYGLIYCATFGVPYIEGCRRWIELCCKRYAEVLVSGVIIEFALSFNSMVFVIGSALCGFGIGYAMSPDSSDPYAGVSDWQRIMYGIFGLLFALLFTYAIFVILSEPIITMCDTLMLCFMECPGQMLSTAKDLADRFNKHYNTELMLKAELQEKQRQEGKKK